MLVIPTDLCCRHSGSYIYEWRFFRISASPIILNFVRDKTGIIFSCVVLLISANVLSFSLIYIKDDKFKSRFTILVLLFILSINFLIYIPHIIILLMGWDGLGLVSFILVIYYQNPRSLAAGMITALTNRLGDVAILLSIALCVNQGHWLIIYMDNSSYLIRAQIGFITLAAIRKRAQMPFSRWLPAAIAAPTPVSALVHSSTLVTAGVFLLIRFYPFLHQTFFFNKVILIVAASTTFIAGIRAITECDFKKIVALSTLRQLGVIIFRLGANMPWLAFFHIVTHALFKALLFICVGSFIHIHRHTQDLRWMGNITNQLPTIVRCITIANLSLCGFPFMSGFYSKDLIIESSMYFSINFPLIVVTLLRLGLTSFYTTRATMVPLIGPSSHRRFVAINEEKEITSATLVLSVIAVLIGSLLRWVSPLYRYSFSLSLRFKLYPFFFIVLGVFLGYVIIILTVKRSKLLGWPQFHSGSAYMWFLVPISTQFMFKFPIFLTHNRMKLIDQGWLEIYSGQGRFIFIKSKRNFFISYSPISPTNYMLIFVSTIIALSASAFFFYIYLNSLYKAYLWRR